MSLEAPPIMGQVLSGHWRYSCESPDKIPAFVDLHLVREMLNKTISKPCDMLDGVSAKEKGLIGKER